MRTRTRTNRRGVLMLAAVAIAALMGGTAFTASNTMPSTTKAGAGTVAASGYTASKIDYTLDATDPSTVSQVVVHLLGATQVPTTSNAKVQLTAAGSWYDCTIGTLNNNGTSTDTTDDYTPLTCTTAGTKTSVSATQDVTLVVVD